jgi:LysM repeat protein
MLVRHPTSRIAAVLLAACIPVVAHAQATTPIQSSVTANLEQVQSSANEGDPLSLASAVARERIERLAMRGYAASDAFAIGRGQSSPRFMTIEGAKGVVPFAIYAWPVAEQARARRPALEFVSELLVGEKGLLKRELTLAPAVATQVRCWIGGQNVELFALEVTARQSADLDFIDQRVETSFQRLRNTGLNFEERQIAAQKGIDPEEIRALFSNELSLPRRSTIEVYPGAAPRFANPKSNSDNTEEEEELLDLDLPLKNTTDLSARNKRTPLISAKSAKLARGVQNKSAALGKSGKNASERLKVSGGVGAKQSEKPRVSKAGRVHSVKKGDSLLALASRYQVRVDAIARANGLKKNGVIVPGQQLTIPSQTP